MATANSRISALEAWKATVDSRDSAQESRISAHEARLLKLEGGVVTPPPPPPPPPPATTDRPFGDVQGNFKNVLKEPFDGTALNPAIWGDNWLGNAGVITPPINGAELAAYDPKQVVVKDGLLNLNAIRSPVTVNGKNYDYRSGCITSHGKKSYPPGHYFEARIYSPAASPGIIANWPAFWTDGENWPTDGENDIYEGLSGHAAYHYHSPSGGPGSSVPGDFTGWHIFGALIIPGKVSYFYDGKAVGMITQDIRNSPNYLILNYGVGGWGGPLLVPATMQCSGVDVYQLV